MQELLHELPAAVACVSHRLKSLHFGPANGARKAYLQCALHADEIPPLLVGWHLRQRLQELEEQGQLRGEVILVPLANPVGLAQEVLGHQVGRFDLATGINFNRGYAHLTSELIPMLEGRLGPEAAQNQRLVRESMRQLLSQAPDTTRSDAVEGSTRALKRLLHRLACDADIVLDLHCDGEALMHLYTGTPLAQACDPLARALGARAVLLARESGDHPFDEALSRIWWELAEHFGPQHPIGLGCFCATVELRGHLDVDHATAQRDAQALIDFLAHSGLVDDDAAHERVMSRPTCAATPLEGVDPLVAPQGGVVVYRLELGAQVKAGEVVCEVVDPWSGQVAQLASRVDGVLFARSATRKVARGDRVAKVAGAVAFRSGKLLSP